MSRSARAMLLRCSFGVWEYLRVKRYFGVECLNTLYYICSHNLTIIDMEATVRVQASFRLKADLVEKLKMSAKACNRSLNNFVESVLMDAVYRTPNAQTMAAVKEAREDKNLETINLDNLEGFIESL